MPRVRAHCFFSGRVQGVFFRYHTRLEAERLGVSGWVRNLPDGRVEAVFEGEEERVRELIEYCKNRQPYARVEKVEVTWESPEGMEGFEIRY